MPGNASILLYLQKLETSVFLYLQGAVIMNPNIVRRPGQIKLIMECRMLGDISVAANIYIITGYTDMRKSVDGLCAIVMEQLKEESNGHSIYFFCGRRCDRIKVLLRKPDGYVLLYKRLDVVQGRYRWPRSSSEVRPITWQQFDWLMSGLEIEQPKALRTA